MCDVAAIENRYGGHERSPGAVFSMTPDSAARLRSGVAAPQPTFDSYICDSTLSAIALAASSADIDGVFTNSVITSIMAPRYFCSTVMLWAIERTSVPAAIDACRSFCDVCWQLAQPSPDRSTSRRAGIDPLALLKTDWKSGDRMRCASSFCPSI